MGLVCDRRIVLYDYKQLERLFGLDRISIYRLYLSLSTYSTSQGCFRDYIYGRKEHEFEVST